ncbi:MAG: proline dehydrogenase family protein [Bacteroidota bacterium]|jgi:proline dehydrogenase
MPMSIFDNTEIAFKSKSNADLNRSYWLFSLVKRPSWVRLGKFVTEAAFAIRLPIDGLVKQTIFRQFCGGTAITDCAAAVNALGQFGIGAILDYSVEGKESEEEFENTCNETLQTIAFASGNPHIPFSVFKVTGVSRFALLEKISGGDTPNADEAAEWKRVEQRVERICRMACEKKVPVFIDAEESWIQPAIDMLAANMMKQFNRDRAWVYNTYQLYRHDRLAFLQQQHREASEGGYHLGAKLVRGAYMEKERQRSARMGYASPIQRDKDSSDRDYDLAMEYCLQHLQNIWFVAGTHNEQSCLKLVEAMKAKGIAPQDEKVFFSQLYGMSDHISYNLSALGYRVAKYLPYGPVKEVLPYLIRRAQENTSVKGQTGRELGLIIREKKRRRMA